MWTPSRIILSILKKMLTRISKNSREMPRNGSKPNFQTDGSETAGKE